MIYLYHHILYIHTTQPQKHPIIISSSISTMSQEEQMEGERRYEQLSGPEAAAIAATEAAVAAAAAEAGVDQAEILCKWAQEEEAITRIEFFEKALREVVQQGKINQVRQFVQKELEPLLPVASSSERVKAELQMILRKGAMTAVQTFSYCSLIL